MVTRATPKSKPARETVTTTAHVPMKASQKEKLEKMAVADRRTQAEVVRILIDDEWDRRQKAAQGNGAAA
jgi:hypothetical protein